MRLPILFAAAVAIAAPLPAMAADWYRVTHTNGGADGYIDAATIRQDGQWTVATLVTINAKPGDSGEKSTESEVQVDCKANQLRIARFEIFGPDRNSLGALEWPDERTLHPVAKGTPFADVATFLCSAGHAGGVRVDDPFSDKP